MKIRNPINECKLVDLETTHMVGICTLNNRKGFLQLRVNPVIEGVRYNKISFILCTKRPYYIYEETNIVEIYGITKILTPKINKFKEMIISTDIKYVKAYIEVKENIIMKKSNSLKRTYDKYLEVQQKINKIKKTDFDLEEYKKLTKEKEKLSETLKDNHLL